MSSTSWFFSRKIGIDLGTANTLIYLEGRGIVLKEPSVVAVRRDTGEVLAVGARAHKMIGRVPENTVIIRPMQDGVVANFDLTQKMLREFISRVYPRRSPFPLQAVVSVSLDVTEIEKRAILEAARQAGARTVYLVENSIAGAMGINLPIEENEANMLVDIGGGTSEAAVITLGGIVSKNCVRLGGGEFNSAIRHYIRKKYNFLVGEGTAEEVKIKIGSALQSSGRQQLEVRGIDLVRRMPGRLMLDSGEITDVLFELVASIVNAIKKTLEDTPVELINDIIVNGITMTGGGALLKDLQQAITKETKIAVSLAENPLDSVVLGTGKMLSSLDLLKKLA